MPLQKHEIRTLVIIGLLLLSLLLYLLLSQKTLEEVIFSHETVEDAQALEIRVWQSNHPYVGSFISISEKIPVDSPAYAELRQLLGKIRLHFCIIQPNGHMLRDGESCEFYFYAEKRCVVKLLHHLRAKGAGVSRPHTQSLPHHFKIQAGGNQGLAGTPRL